MWRQKAAAAGESVEAEVPQETSRPHQEMKPLDPLHIERQTSSGQDLDLKKKKKFWWLPVVPLSLIVDAPMVEILKSYVAYFSSYCIHKIFLNLIRALDLKVKSNSTFSLQR